MKNLFLALAFLFSLSLQAQDSDSTKAVAEKINWNNLKMYAVKNFEFKTPQAFVKCTNCRLIEIETLMGTTGYYLLGEGTYDIPSEKMKDKLMCTLIRLNPEDVESTVKMEGKTEINDAGFKAHSRLILANIFKRSYHAGMDALIPANGDYTCDIFGIKDGDFLASCTGGTLKVVRISR